MESFYKSKKWHQLRTLVLRRDGYLCVICNINVRPKGTSRVDHIVPVKTDPTIAMDMTNLRTLCASCDNKRHAEKRSGKEYMEIDSNGYPNGW